MSNTAREKSRKSAQWGRSDPIREYKNAGQVSTGRCDSWRLRDSSRGKAEGRTHECDNQ